jgi:hypothetical protein
VVEIDAIIRHRFGGDHDQNASPSQPQMHEDRTDHGQPSPIIFIPGIELSRRYFHDAIEPVIGREFSGLRYAAALIGYGSEILGFDTPTSTDHNWGPRVLLFFSTEDRDRCGAEVLQRLDEQIPKTFLAWPTRSKLDDPTAADADAEGRRPAALRIELYTLPAWVRAWLGIDAEREPDWRAWLGVPEQALLEVTEGAVYRDDAGELSALRRRLAYFPRDIWLYKLACQWARIGQEQAFVGRCGDVGDDIGSRIIAARLARDVMRLCFLIERRYAPYPKWFGTAFAKLSCAPEIGPLIFMALTAGERRGREAAIAEACRRAAELHVRLGNPGALQPRVMTFSELNRRPGDRPSWTTIAPERDFTVINAADLAEAVRAKIDDPEIAALAFTGAVDQFSDSADLLEWPRLTHAAAQAVSLDREARKRPPPG